MINFFSMREAAYRLALELFLPHTICMAKGRSGCAVAMQLEPSLPPGIESPEQTVPGVSEAALEISRYLQAGGKMAIFSDYDPDGTCGAAALRLALTDFDKQLKWGFASADQGTGLSEDFVRKAYRDGVRLLVTVDLGSSDPSAVELAHSLGIRVVVTDHHAPSPACMPDHHLNPQLADTAPEASGAVVAFKLALALETSLYGAPRESTLSHGAFLAAFGARADMMNMSGQENSALFSFGSPPPGVMGAAQSLGLKSFSATNCAKLAAVLNLPKRCSAASARDAETVLSASSELQAKRALGRLLEVQEAGRQASKDFGSTAARQMSAQPACRVANAVVDSSDAHLYAGYAGIVAMRMSGVTGRPAVIFVPLDAEGSSFKYSVRWTSAPEGEGLLSSVPDLSRLAQEWQLSPPGGHPKAMGGLCRDPQAVLEALEQWAQEQGLKASRLESSTQT